ncbi:multicomponent Na+:H+ antiporter subunit C [Cytobacillus horneckiae]|uniref:Na(+)/H(+) antiporter subunit C n=1 Tax=Cytobacillus horneckiae TaxID=549687 RepID=A0A2N0ZAU8_9BACI|nr:Na(+)/H(+) antiporter subunit C [Cytobacillus horneckiae]NRG44403.1 Na(+)/H(+) antiporter subunit C [Bacillus sp. CRN 9]MBN6887845.1 Na(+)/H(+) antiporter subunit C [Cytobacillus horneckiae]MCM3179799.1 Na(+)/H(+) antiporter subunit C [Cytobacillus horneckiae]MEC1155186.1 Na(+)/H(+) antiporter subunit C [Cytobacillus horneckiae]MED2936761.1 Na(+)/H(+) antiporter subunit C [Cytobacillus horneckiae]
MESLMSILIGVFFAIGTYLILTKSLLRIILGTSIISHGVHLLIITMGGVKAGGPPLLGLGSTSFTDALPQALILTAIVINFATTAIFLVLSYRSYKVLGTDDTAQMRGNEDE